MALFAARAAADSYCSVRCCSLAFLSLQSLLLLASDSAELGIFVPRAAVSRARNWREFACMRAAEAAPRYGILGMRSPFRAGTDAAIHSSLSLCLYACARLASANAATSESLRRAASAAAADCSRSPAMQSSFQALQAPAIAVTAERLADAGRRCGASDSILADRISRPSPPGLHFSSH